MIEIKMTGICEGCKHADLKLHHGNLGNFSFKTQRVTGFSDWYLYCTHEEACSRWEKEEQSSDA